MPHIIWNPSHPSHHGFAVAAPVLVQENHQTPVDVVHLNKEAMTMSGKRGLRVFNNLFLATEEPLENSEESSAARPSLPSGTEKPQPSIPETPSTMSDEDYELVEAGAHAPPNPGTSTESSHESTEVHVPLSSHVFPTWFHQTMRTMD